MELKLLNAQGQAAGTTPAPETVFGREFNEALVHQIVVAYQANARQGTRAQKDRTTVKHSTRKPWRQKGTGRARAGMTSSPIWRGGGRTFPNAPDENFTQKVNKKMYRAGMTKRASTSWATSSRSRKAARSPRPSPGWSRAWSRKLAKSKRHNGA